MLQTHDLIGIVDTRIEESTPTTNYRSSDLGIYGGPGFVRSFVLNASTSSFYSFAEYDQIESFKLYLTPKTKTGIQNSIVIKCAPVTAGLDARFITWNNRTAADTWSTAGALNDIDLAGLTTQTVTHSLGEPAELDVTTPVRAALMGGKSAVDLILWTEDTGEGFTYYSMEEATVSRRPIIRVIYKGPQFSERIGSASMPSMPII